VIAIQDIHPMLVHFPIVFFLTLAAFDVIAVLRGVNVTGRSTVGAISAGLAVLAGVFAVVTFVFGDMALEVAQAAGLPETAAETHEGLGTVTAIAFVVWALVRAFAWWRNFRGSRAAEGGVALVEVAGALLVIATAYFGGELVYSLGVNVAHAAGG
jgi:uncharacterized membrane protein